MQYDINAFVKEALAKGASRSDIESVLKKAGWPADDVRASLEAFADVPFVVPVPRRKPYLSAREAFMYLLTFLCLYISAFAFGSVLFYFIKQSLPDPLNPYDTGSVSTVRMAVASLIIAFPLYLWLSSLLMKAMRRDPEKRGSKVRKWLTYITLFVAAGVIIGDLIALLYNLFEGDLTLRFILKVLTVLLIAGLIFGYYLWDLRNEEKDV